MQNFLAGEPILGLNFVAIDFETANRHRKSACSLGLAMVRDGVVVQTRDWLIRPEPYEVEVYNYRVHGISIDMLEDKNDFGTLWPEIEPFLTGEVIVAHNASFDMGVLFALSEHYGFDLNYDFDFCTHITSGLCWPELGSTRLNEVAKYLSVELEHHNARSDAYVSAKIAIEIARCRKVNSLAEVKGYQGFQLSRQLNLKGPKVESSFVSSSPLPSADLSGLNFSDLCFDEINWIDKKVCVTGVFYEFPDREVLIDKLTVLGASRQSSINSKTNIVIIGGDAGPAKVKTIKDLISKGFPIIVLNESHVSKFGQKENQLPKGEYLGQQKLDSAPAWFISNLTSADQPIEYFQGEVNGALVANRRVVVTGDFMFEPNRENILSVLRTLNAVPQSSVNSKTQVVMIGEGAGPAKIAKIRQLIADGADIILLNELQTAKILG